MPGAYDAHSLDRHFGLIGRRLEQIEAQLAILSAKLDVPYAPPTADVPPEVLELVYAGKRLDAMARYRALTGATAAEARDVIVGL